MRFVTEKIGLVTLAIMSVAVSTVFAFKKHWSVAEKIVFAAETIFFVSQKMRLFTEMI